MKLLSAQQIQQWDAFTMQTEPIASIDLMERAAMRCVDWIISSNFINQNIKIFCGKGNNGGDGLAIARLLIEKGFSVTVYILEFGAKGTDDFQVNLQKLHLLSKEIHFIQSSEFLPVIERTDVVIDALYGSGLNRPLKDLNALLVEHINQFAVTVISIDVPSGMSIDKSSKGNNIICATTTLTFQSLKLCFLMAENEPFFGEVQVLNIDLHPDYLLTAETVFEVIEKNDIASFIQPRKRFSHKGHFGHALIIAGNAGKMGAAVMACGAALRSGCGLVSANISKEFANALHATFPEAMVMLREKGLMELNKYTSLAIGPGLGTDEAAEQLLEQVLQDYPHAMIIDADALNILSFHKEWLKKIPAGTVLTPHPKEFDRLFGNCENDFERINKAIALTEEFPFIITLKGHHTCIASNGKAVFNTTGNAGLAKGGSGDVLCGMMVSFMAQHYSPVHAAAIAVYLHGLAADLSLENQSMESLLATDVMNAIGKAFNFLT
jgi:hydroxyethylthiazole kinase-like uncharacterized protein yjeF